MIPLVLAVLGGSALAAALVVLRSFGPRYRVGRLLASVPEISIADARRLAEAGERRYVRIAGRIDGEAEFEDENHRPLVFRRTTYAWRPANGGAWTEFDRSVETVPFVVREGLDEIDVETGELGDGLVVVPRESRGNLADLGDRAPAGVPEDAAARLVVEQVSSVEHAVVLGLPIRAADGHVTLTAGLGRPLILTTLEGDEGMRVLTGGAVGRARIALIGLAAGVVLLGIAAIWWLVEAVAGGGVAAALAASPDPSLRPGSDTRSSGAGPGLVGDPLLAIGGVAAIAAVSVLASLAYFRFTASRPTHPASAGERGKEPPERRS